MICDRSSLLGIASIGSIRVLPAIVLGILSGIISSSRGIGDARSRAIRGTFGAISPGVVGAPVGGTAVVIAAAIATAMASVTAVTSMSTMSTVPTVVTGRAGLELFVLLLDIGNQILTQRLGTVNHFIIGTTMNLVSKHPQ